MADVIDELQIEINAKASKANEAIDRLVGKLDRLTTSLGKINGTNLNGLANGVQRLGNAMQVMNTIKTADFTRLAKNLTRLGTVNVSALNSAASSMSHLTRAFNSLGTVSANAQAVGDMAKNIAKLGNKSVQTAITNIPQLATAMNNLMATLSRSPQVSQNVIQMTNALANLASQGSKVGSASNSIVRGLNKTSTSANTARKSFGGLASAIGKFYAKYFMVIRGLKGLWSSIESTADYLETYNYFNVSIGKIGSDWSHQWEQYAEKVGVSSAEEYAESFSSRLSESLGNLSGLKIEIGADGKGIFSESGTKNLGLNIKEITQYASQIASVTNSVGLTGEASLAAAESFTKLAGDISSLFNIDYSSVSKNLQSALIGQSRSVYKFGIDITNATLQQYAYNLGIEKAVKDMTQAEKMQLRMIAILDQSKVSWGDQANTINSISNQFRQFKNNIKEVGMTIGQLFIPVMEKIMPIANGVTIAVKRMMATIASIFGINLNLNDYSQGYTEIEDSVSDMGESMDDAADSAKKLKNQVLGIDELNVLSQKESNSDLSSSDKIDLTDKIIDATDSFNDAWNNAYSQMKSKSQAIADNITKMLEPIVKIIEKISVGDWEGSAKSIGEFITNLLSVDLTRFSEAAGEAINTFLKTLIKIITSIDFKKIFSAADEALRAFLGGLFGFSNKDSSFLAVLASGIEALIAAFFVKTAVSAVISAISAAITKFSAAIQFLQRHPFFSMASGISALLFAISSYTENEAKNNQIEKYGTSLSTLSEGLSSIQDRIVSGKKAVENAGDAEIAYVQGLIDKYFELSRKEYLSKEEAESLKKIQEEIEKLLPGFSEAIDNNTGSFEKQKTAVQGLVAELEKQYKLQAVQEYLKDLYLQQLELKKGAEEAKKVMEGLGEEYSEFQKKFPKGDLGTAFAGNVYQTLMGRDYQKEFQKAQRVYLDYLKELKGIDEEIEWAFSEMGIKNRDKLTEKFTSIFDSVGETMKNGSDTLNEIMKKLGESLSDIQAEGFESKEDETSRRFISTNKQSIKDASNDKQVQSDAKQSGKKIAQSQSSGYASEEKPMSTNIASVSGNAINSAKKPIYNSSVNLGVEMANGIIAGLNSMTLAVGSAISALTAKKTSVNSSVKASGKRGKSGTVLVPRYETGGLPEDGWFRASKGEYFGSFDDGTSVIANNNQIINGIANGVKDANAEQNALLREQNALLREILAKDMSVNIGDREIARANERGKRSMGYAIIS